MSWCVLNYPNGAISWERLKCLCLRNVNLNENIIENILSGSPCLESLKLKDCYRYRRIDVTSKSVKKLVFSGYFSYITYEKDYIDCIEINAPYISSLTIKRGLVLRELVLLDVSSLVEVDLDYSINLREYVIFEEEVFRGCLGLRLELDYLIIASPKRFRFGNVSLDPLEEDKSNFRLRLFSEIGNLNDEHLLKLVNSDCDFRT
nr:hypothetical protein [Tanacetum cinerariifolium]